MNDEEIEGVMCFLRKTEQLKNTMRSARTSTGRVESTAEHTWRLCLMPMLFEKEYPSIDILRLIKMCLIHDLGEAVCGDVPAVEQIEGRDKNVEERKGFISLIEVLPSSMQESMLGLWDEYETAASPEASLAKAFDKLETILQHTQGKNPEDFNYSFNLDYGKKYTDRDCLTAKLREIIDTDTKQLAESNTL